MSLQLPTSWMDVAKQGIQSTADVLKAPPAASSAIGGRAESDVWSNFDSSGWTVATGGSKAAGGVDVAQLAPWLIGGAVVILGAVYLIVRKR
jgi:hypothetical protein